MTNQQVAELLITISRRVDAKGLVTATDGNISARLPGGSILATPTSMNKGVVTIDDLVEVTITGEQIGGARRPSTEMKMHLFIYRQRPDVHAVVHCHPIYATGFAAAGKPLPQNIFPEIIVGLGEIPLAPYATPSTDAVAESLTPFVADHDAVLLANHGAVTYGPDLWDACYKMEKLEQAAHMLFVAEGMGGAKQLSADQVAQLKILAATIYKK